MANEIDTDCLKQGSFGPLEVIGEIIRMRARFAEKGGNAWADSWSKLDT